MTCTTIRRTAFEVIVGIRDRDLSVVSNHLEERTMARDDEMSRRQFVATAVSTAALASIPAQRLFAMGRTDDQPSGQRGPDLIANPSWKDQGVENLAKSPHAKLRNIPVRAVTINDGFWSQRRKINVTKSIPSMRELLEANGRMNNFRRLIGRSDAEQHGPVFSDSDVYKWTEAVGFALGSGDLTDLRPTVDKMIDEVVAAQEPSGYLNTYYVDDRKGLWLVYREMDAG